MSELKWFVLGRGSDVTPEKIPGRCGSGCSVPHRWAYIQQRPEAGAWQGLLGARSDPVRWTLPSLSLSSSVNSKGLIETVWDETLRQNLNSRPTAINTVLAGYCTLRNEAPATKYRSWVIQCNGWQVSHASVSLPAAQGPCREPFFITLVGGAALPWS